MSKELLENLLIEFDEMGYEPTTLCDTEREVESFRRRLKQVLDDLKVIDNANSSEALERLEEIGKTIMFTDEETLESKTLKEIMPNHYKNIKQAIIKAQEQEKVLSIIKEKCLTNCNLALVEDNVHYENYCKEFEYFLNKYNESPNGFEITKEDLLAQEEFELLKRWQNGK